MNNKSKIGSFAKVRRGASPRPIGDSKYFGGDVGWIRISDVTASNKYLKKTQQYVSPLGESLSVRVDKGDLVMSICGTIGRPIIIDFPSCIHDGFVQLYEITNADTEYLYYILQYHEKDLENKGQPGTQVNLNTGIVEDFEIFSPPLPTQRKIAHILSTADAVIEKTQAAIAKYKAIKQGMLHDLFTRGIVTEPTSYKDKTGKVVELRRNQLRPKYEDAPELYKESNLGWIPKEWEVDEFQFVCDFITDGSHFSPTPMEDGEIIANVKDMGENGIDYESCTRISKEEFDLLKKQNCRPLFGDVLLSKDGTIGRVVLFNEKREIMLLSSIAILRPSKNINSEYLYCFLKSEYFYKQLLIKTSGSALKRIVLRDINTLLLAFPIDKIEQEMISKRIIQIESKLKSEQNYLHKLQQIKAGLMADLLSGKKEVLLMKKR
jgi:type I restriction enzyme, S subunit